MKQYQLYKVYNNRIIPTTLNRAIVLESAGGHESLFVGLAKTDPGAAYVCD